MKITAQIASHLRQVHEGGNWTSVNLIDTLKDVDWKMATTKIEGFNTIAGLVYHMHYYVREMIPVLQGQPLTAHDALSYDVSAISQSENWTNLVNKTIASARTLALLIEAMPDDRLSSIFDQEKYGTFHRNLWGVIEHSHYHLGQIVLLKKWLAAQV
jgi:uncharacterized damage-inducible protein DinB